MTMEMDGNNGQRWRLTAMEHAMDERMVTMEGNGDGWQWKWQWTRGRQWMTMEMDDNNGWRWQLTVMEMTMDKQTAMVDNGDKCR